MEERRRESGACDCRLRDRRRRRRRSVCYTFVLKCNFFRFFMTSTKYVTQITLYFKLKCHGRGGTSGISRCNDTKNNLQAVRMAHSDFNLVLKVWCRFCVSKCKQATLYQVAWIFFFLEVVNCFKKRNSSIK